MNFSFWHCHIMIDQIRIIIMYSSSSLLLWKCTAQKKIKFYFVVPLAVYNDGEVKATGTGSSCSHHIHRRKKAVDLFSLRFGLHLHSYIVQNSLVGNTSNTIKTGFPISINATKTVPHRYSQRAMSQMQADNQNY